MSVHVYDFQLVLLDERHLPTLVPISVSKLSATLEESAKLQEDGSVRQNGDKKANSIVVADNDDGDDDGGGDNDDDGDENDGGDDGNDLEEFILHWLSPPQRVEASD